MALPWVHLVSTALLRLPPSVTHARGRARPRPSDDVWQKSVFPQARQAIVHQWHTIKVLSLGMEPSTQACSSDCIIGILNPKGPLSTRPASVQPPSPCSLDSIQTMPVCPLRVTYFFLPQDFFRTTLPFWPHPLTSMRGMLPRDRVFARLVTKWSPHPRTVPGTCQHFTDICQENKWVHMAEWVRTLPFQFFLSSWKPCPPHYMFLL
jgi:hypothetical protein